MYRLVQRRGIIGLFCLLFVASSVVPGWAQKDNRFEVSKNLDIFNSLLKEVEMFYVDSVDVDKTVQRGIEAMLAGLDPYTEYYPEQKTEELSLMTTGFTDGRYGHCRFTPYFFNERPGGKFTSKRNCSTGTEQQQ